MNRPLYSPVRIQEMLERYGFSFSKALGQNFLIDGNIIEKIAETAGIDGANVLEIGPGFGVLTDRLAEEAKKVLAVEMDERLEPVLAEVLADRENVTVLFNDVLKLDLKQVLADQFPDEPVKMVANLPYYVTTPILAHLLESDLPLDSVTVMVQKEVAKRMVAKPGTKDYGSLTLLIDYYSRSRLAFTVPNTVFMPRPKVESAVVHLELKDVPAFPELFQTVHAAFQMRRKTLLNALNKGLGKDKEEIRRALQKADLPENIRGERLSLEDFILLTKEIFHIPY